MRKIAFINEKGGSGKTTLTLNVGASLAGKGARVLILDMDPQGHIGKSLGLDVARIWPTVTDLLLDPGVKIEETARPTDIPNLWITPSNKLLTDFPVNVSSDPERHLRLQQKLNNAYGFDFILIDSPPSIGLSTVNILMAVEEVVIPVSLTYLALDGCVEIIDTVETMRRNFNHTGLHVSLVVGTFYRNNDLVNSILRKLRSHFGSRMARTVIEYDMKLDQAQSFGKSIFDFAPDSVGARQMATVAEEVRDANG